MEGGRGVLIGKNMTGQETFSEGDEYMQKFLSEDPVGYFQAVLFRNLTARKRLRRKRPAFGLDVL